MTESTGKQQAFNEALDTALVQWWKDHPEGTTVADFCRAYPDAANYRTARTHAKALGLKGKLGYKPTLPGWEVSRISNTLDSHGNVERTSIVQVPERTQGPFVMPPLHQLERSTVQTDRDGQITQSWHKTKKDQSATHMLAAIDEVLQRHAPFTLFPTPPQDTSAKLATVYNIADHHLGMYAWAKETGEDYDVQIADKLLFDAMASLVARGPSSSVGVVLNLGDFFHSDNSENRTIRSGNVLDVDTRYAKVMSTGVELLFNCVELALQRHDKVVVRNLPGNHDPHASLALTLAMQMAYRNEPRVFVDDDPSPFFWWRWGRVFLGATHGHMVKPTEMPGVMASMRPLDWGESQFRYAYFGHVHHKSIGGGERAGMTWETFQALTPKDAWHSSMGYVSGRSLVAITHHQEKGEIIRNYEPVITLPKRAISGFPT